MLLQLNPPLPLDTPKGKATAHFLIDYGSEFDLLWVTFLDSNGECWTWPNPKIRAQKNITMGRAFDGITPPREMPQPDMPRPAVNGTPIQIPANLT